jgi:carboxypeptidase family protein
MDWAGETRISLHFNFAQRGRSKQGTRSFGGFFFGVFSLLFLCLPSARAQISASISGVVTDPSGAPVPAASVTSKNLETSAVRTTQTDAAGRYQIPALSVGEYEVRVAKSGFREKTRSGIHLAVGQEASATARIGFSRANPSINGIPVIPFALPSILPLPAL